MRRNNPYYSKPKNIRDNGIEKRLARILIAVVIFTASYILTVYIDRLLTFMAAIGFKYEPQLHFWGISGLPTKYQEWSKLRVLFVFGAATFGLAFIILLITALYRDIKSKIALKLFVLYLSINCLCLISANLATSIIGLDNFNSVYFMNFSVIFLWWGIPPFFLYFLVISWVPVIIIIGYLLTDKVLRFSHSVSLVRKYRGRIQVVSELFFLPFLISLLIMLPFSMDNYYFLTFHSIALAFLFIGMLIRVQDYYRIKGVYRKDIVKIKTWQLLAFAFPVLLPLFNQ